MVGLRRHSQSTNMGRERGLVCVVYLVGLVYLVVWKAAAEGIRVEWGKGGKACLQ